MSGYTPKPIRLGDSERALWLTWLPDGRIRLHRSGYALELTEAEQRALRGQLSQLGPEPIVPEEPEDEAPWRKPRDHQVNEYVEPGPLAEPLTPELARRLWGAGS